MYFGERVAELFLRPNQTATSRITTLVLILNFLIYLFIYLFTYPEISWIKNRLKKVWRIFWRKGGATVQMPKQRITVSWPWSWIFWVIIYLFIYFCEGHFGRRLAKLFLSNRPHFVSIAWIFIFCFVFVFLVGRGGQFWRKGGGIMVSNWLLQQTTLQHQHHPPNLVFVGRGHYFIIIIILFFYYRSRAAGTSSSTPPTWLLLSKRVMFFWPFVFSAKFGHY